MPIISNISEVPQKQEKDATLRIVHFPSYCIYLGNNVYFFCNKVLYRTENTMRYWQTNKAECPVCLWMANRGHQAPALSKKEKQTKEFFREGNRRWGWWGWDLLMTDDWFVGFGYYSILKKTLFKELLSWYIKFSPARRGSCFYFGFDLQMRGLLKSKVSCIWNENQKNYDL